MDEQADVARLGSAAGQGFEQWKQLGSFQLKEQTGATMVCSAQLRQRCSMQWRSLRRNSDLSSVRGSSWVVLSGAVVEVDSKALSGSCFRPLVCMVVDYRQNLAQTMRARVVVRPLCMRYWLASLPKAIV